MVFMEWVVKHTVSIIVVVTRVLLEHVLSLVGYLRACVWRVVRVEIGLRFKTYRF
jgi:hypothetical protein